MAPRTELSFLGFAEEWAHEKMRKTNKQKQIKNPNNNNKKPGLLPVNL